MSAWVEKLVPVVLASILSGAVTGIASVAAVSVHIQWLRTDIDYVSERLDRVERRQFEESYQFER